MTDTSLADTRAPSAADLLDDPGGAGAPGADKPFYESFTDAANKEWAAKAGFKSAEDVAALARKFDPFKDADPASLVRLPAADAKPEEFIALAQKMGLPKDVSGYNLGNIEGIDKDRAEAMAPELLKLGFLPFQVEGAVKALIQAEGALMERNAKEAQERVATEVRQLERDPAFKEKQASGKRALSYMLRQGGVAKEQADTIIDALQQAAGVGATINMFAAMGNLIREDSFIEGSPGGEEKHVLGRGWYNHPDNKR